ncbi:MAG: aminotransferase class I/II-fold pyridoxal phosphate-dependent enzyme [Saprospiraceae bacterium]
MTRVSILPHLKNIKPSATLFLNERTQRLIAQGRNVYRLGFGQSPFPVPEEVVQALQTSAHQKNYLPVKGLPALRKAVAAYNRKTLALECGPENILIGPGSKELLLGLQMATDADLLLPTPSWVSYEPQAQIARKKVIWLETEERNKWLLTADQLDQACKRLKARPKMLLLNYPNNPVGSTYEPDELGKLAVVAREHQVVVIADEIYGALEFTGTHHSLAQYYPEGTIISAGLSKWCGAGGWRLGTFTFPDECIHLLQAMATIASESFSAVSTPVQYAAVRAFEGSEVINRYLELSRRILHVLAQYVYHELIAHQVTMPAPEGGFYLFPNFNAYRSALIKREIFTSTTFCEHLLEETGVALLPGEAFGRPENEYTCRLAFVDFDGGVALAAADNDLSTALDESFIRIHCPLVHEGITRLCDWLEGL